MESYKKTFMGGERGPKNNGRIIELGASEVIRNCKSFGTRVRPSFPDKNIWYFLLV